MSIRHCRQTTCGAALAAILATGCLTPTSQRAALSPLVPPGADDAERAFAGLSLRDQPGVAGTVVSWIRAGPLRGTGFHSPYINRGDILLRANGRPMTAAEFSRLVNDSRPGDTLMLELTRTGGRADTAVPTPGASGEVVALPLVLGRKSDWAGPIASAAPVTRPVAPLLGLVQGRSKLEQYLDGELAAVGIAEPVSRLLKLFAETQEGTGGFHALSRVSRIFARPTQMPQVVAGVTAPLAILRRDPRLILVRAAENLDARVPNLRPATDLSVPRAAVAAVGRVLAEADALTSRAFAAIDAETRRQIPVALGAYQTEFDPSTPNPAVFIRCLRASLVTDFDALLAAAAALSGLAPESSRPAADLPAAALPRALRRSVTGDVLAVARVGGRWIVFGGAGANTYDLSAVAGVIDAGGDDVYRYEREARPRVQAVVDMAGNDRYESEGAGPASATLGVSLLVDYAGDDEYRGGLRACGAALFGVGLLIDHGGSDTYHGSRWSIGAGFYGVGAVVDLGGGKDVYWAHTASEGVGGPRGFGLIYDGGGGDLYRANGPTPSAYGVAATYYGLSQGVGFGVRGYDTGGIGIIADMGGSDRYEGGEFSQGGGYYWGLGIIDDRAGNDLYYGDRYSQGFGCHQAAGALLDHAGDDTYWSLLAANQGGAWDIGMGLLLDYAGNDAYRADGLAQGGAAMQGIAWLIDLGGADRYTAGRGTTQGQSSGNAYHYDRTGCLSWSLFLDAGGAWDDYSTGRPNNQRLAPGKANRKRPQDSGLHGLFIDAPTALDLGL